MKKHSILLSLLCWLFVALSAQAQVANGSEVMIQGFNWESHKNTLGWYNVVKGKAADLKASRFDAIWMPPPHDAASNEGYLPRQLYNLTSKYGNQASLVDMINTLHANNVKVLADIVINHRVGTTNWGDFTNPTWPCNSVAKGDEWVGACGNGDSGDGYSAARDVDHSNATVQNDIKAWMNWLKTTIGFDGWRYDYVRGYWGGYNKIYNQATNPYFSVGELWDNLDLNNPDPHRQQTTNWIDATGGTSTAFDFTTKGVLQQAVQGQLYRLNNNGKAPGVIGWWPAKAVTFLDNHDTGSTQAHWPFPGDKVMQGYAYILTHPGTPMVFWDHYYDWGLYNEIKTLVNVRKNNGLKSTSVLEIKAASANLYAAIIDGKVAMKIGSDAWSPGAGWTVAASGTNYAVWTKAATTDTTAPTLTVNPASGTFSSAVTVTMSATDNVTPAPAIYYTVDGSNPTTGSAQYSGSFTVSSTTTVRAIAVDAAGNQSAIVSRTYTIGSTSGGFTIYFKKPTSWTTARLHYWNAIPTGSLAGTTWPGVSMVADGGDWFKFTFTNVTSIDLLFHNNAGVQTADLTRNKTGWYVDGRWYDSDPRTGLKIHFKRPATWTSATLYYWNTTPAGAAAVTWPGVQMVSEGNGWFVFTIPSTSCSSLIFSNNGATQTADLSRCGEGWYANGTWYNSLPAGVRVEYDEKEQSLGLELQNYPNPFSGSTTISFSLPESEEVTLKVYNVFGQEVATLKNEKMESGSYEVQFDAGKLSNGMYTYKLQAGQRSITKKMIVNN